MVVQSNYLFSMMLKGVDEKSLKKDVNIFHIHQINRIEVRI